MIEPSYTCEQGPHKGWTRHRFTYRDREWSLLTIDTETERKSLIHPHRDGVRDGPWPDFHILTLQAIITRRDVYCIIDDVYRVYEEGVETGRKKQAAEIRKALNP